MGFLAGPSRESWQPVVTADTTVPGYWLNWKVFVCAIWVLVSMVLAFTLIWKYEGGRDSKNGRAENREQSPPPPPPPGILYEDEVWKPCLKGVHPAWLLAFRVVAFFVLLILLFLNVAVDGVDILYFYTQWTFTLVTIYFGLGSLLSIYGCYQYHNKVRGDSVNSGEFDAEQGADAAAARTPSSNPFNRDKFERSVRQTAGFWGYVFQIIFQMNAGAVLLTDCVFWFIIVPFLAIKDYRLNFLIIYMHTINAVFLLGDTALNCLRFPWFRIAYFYLWTIAYVIFQWILHACVSLWWPYPFLDLSSPFAPLWYSSVALLHIPCYGVFVLVMKMKHFLLSKWLPHSYQCTR